MFGKSLQITFPLRIGLGLRLKSARRRADIQYNHCQIKRAGMLKIRLLQLAWSPSERCRRRQTRTAPRGLAKLVVCAISEEDRHYMQSALNLARRGLGKTAPNPAVGCIILRDGQVNCTSICLASSSTFALLIKRLKASHAVLKPSLWNGTHTVYQHIPDWGEFILVCCSIDYRWQCYAPPGYR